jgi:hypothetical protein
VKKRNMYCIVAIFVVVVYEIQNEHTGRCVAGTSEASDLTKFGLRIQAPQKGMTKFSSLVPVMWDVSATKIPYQQPIGIPAYGPS